MAIRSPPLPTTSIKIPTDVKVTAAIWRELRRSSMVRNAISANRIGAAASNRIDKAHVADPIRLDQQAVIGKYRDRRAGQPPHCDRTGPGHERKHDEAIGQSNRSYRPHHQQAVASVFDQRIPARVRHSREKNQRVQRKRRQAHLWIDRSVPLSGGEKWPSASANPIYGLPSTAGAGLRTVTSTVAQKRLP